MSIRYLGLAAAALLALPLVADASHGAQRQEVHGRMSSTTTGGAERGRFLLSILDRGNGAHAERMQVEAHHLNVATATSSSTPPSFHVWLLLANGSSATSSASADFGAMRVNRHGDAVLLFDTRHSSLPSGVVSIADYGDGTIEIQDGSGTVVCSGTIPAFGGGQGSAVFGHAGTRLTSTSSTFRGVGDLQIARQNVRGTTQEEMSITVGHMASGATYTAVAVDASNNVTTLGQFTTSNPRGLGGFRISTRQGGTIPGGGLSSLAGQTVNVLDSNNSAVLTGTFPSIP